MSEQAEKYWFARHSTSIIFLIIVLAIIEIYEAFQIPIAVFPTTNFPLIKVDVNNNVMPIEQIKMTITQPIEQTVSLVPKLQSVRSITNHGSTEIDLFFN